MKNNIQFIYIDNNEQIICSIKYNNKTFTGVAKCHPDDKDFCNRLTGEEISYKRALIKVVKERIKENKIKLQALNQLYYSTNNSKYYNPKDYMALSLHRQIELYKTDIETLKKWNKTIESELNTYIELKDVIYKKLRKIRNKDEIN